MESGELDSYWFLYTLHTSLQQFLHLWSDIRKMDGPRESIVEVRSFLCIVIGDAMLAVAALIPVAASQK